MADMKKVISKDDPEYLTKCQQKVCYICGEAASKYVPMYCQGKGDKKHEETCPLCKDNLPANVPICGKRDCVSQLVDQYTDPIDKNEQSIKIIEDSK